MAQPRLNDDLRMFRARFYLQQYNECQSELASLASDIPQEEKDLWQRRVTLETQLTAVAQNEFPKSTTPNTDILFQEHIMNLYALFVLSPQNDLKAQVLQPLEAYLYQPELYNNIFLHIYGGLILWKANKHALARDLLTRTSIPGSANEVAEFLMEKLYIMLQICLQKNLLNESAQVVDQMNVIDSDDILTQLAKMDLAAMTPSPKPDVDEESPLLALTNEIVSRYGPALRPMVLQSTELIRQSNYRQAYTILKQARELCTQQGLPFPAEIQINSIICLHHRSFSNLSQSAGNGPVYQQQQQQVETTIANMEAELQQSYPNHPFFAQRDALIAKIKAGIANNNISTI